MFFPPKFQSVITIIKNDYNVLHTGLLKYVHIFKIIIIITIVNYRFVLVYGMGISLTEADKLY